MFFCKKCMQEMQNGKDFDGVDGIRIKGIFYFGTVLLGKSEVCKVCKSYIATKWLVLVFPVFGLASYRLNATPLLGDEKYNGKQISLYKPHIKFAFIAYLIILVFVVSFFVFIILSHPS